MENLKIFTENIESKALEQIEEIKGHLIFKNETIRIMPDVHAGLGCVIGFTSTNNTDKIIPNLIGVDIGCGMMTVKLGNISIDYNKLDNFICENIKSGFNVNEDYSNILISEEIKESIENVANNIGNLNKYKYYLKSLGTLGGGNHFIEVSVDKENNKYLIIHSGSRNFGHSIATYYQDMANKKCDYSKDLNYLEKEDAKNYLRDMKVAQKYASLNRKIIATEIVTKGLGIKDFNSFETIHNYIDKDNIIRKGAISAKREEVVLIPINMRDGSILAKGKGNIDWNNSAPHGAGRLMSRAKAKRNIDLEEFKIQMKDVYTSSVCKATLDEAPEAYKSINDIINNISETVDIIAILKPTYNFKAH